MVCSSRGPALRAAMRGIRLVTHAHALPPPPRTMAHGLPAASGVTCQTAGRRRGERSAGLPCPPAHRPRFPRDAGQPRHRWCGAQQQLSHALAPPAAQSTTTTGASPSAGTACRPARRPRSRPPSARSCRSSLSATPTSSSTWSPCCRRPRCAAAACPSTACCRRAPRPSLQAQRAAVPRRRGRPGGSPSLRPRAASGCSPSRARCCNLPRAPRACAGACAACACRDPLNTL